MTLAAIHPNSAYAAKTHDRNVARADRRAICAYIASMGSAGASDDDIARNCPGIHANSLRLRRQELQRKLRADGYTGYGFITDNLGERGKSSSGMPVTKYHVTQLGLKALGRPMTDFHVFLGENET